MRLTNPLWYLAALLLAIGSLMAAVAVAASAFDPVRDATVTPITERIDASGKTLAVYTDLVQPERTLICRGRYGKDDAGRVAIPSEDVGITAQGDGTRWTLVGVLVKGRDGLRVVCTPDDERVDNATYGYATVTGYESAANNGRGIAYIGVAAAVVLAGWIFWCRRIARRERRSTATVDP